MLLPIISVEDLNALWHSEAVLLVDASSGKMNNPNARFLNRAVYVDLESQLAEVPSDAAKGGRHPLPDPIKFSKLLGQLGISNDSRVVVYDDKFGSNAAARFWWMLKALGHDAVQVLDGGEQAAIAAGFETSKVPETLIPVQYTIRDSWQLPTVRMDEVERALQTGKGIVIDVRDAARFRGEVEPIDLVAGHIPGAINMPFMANLEANSGRFKPAPQLRELYEPLIGNNNPREVIVHCGSGVTACHTLLAMAHAGFPIPSLYVGSWSEWSRNKA